VHREILRAVATRAMRDYGLLPEFGPEVLAELDRIDGRAAVSPASSRKALSAGEGTRDLRDLPWCSIDNDDSLDLDQLTVAQPAHNGATRILVAIADVDALVKAGCAIDAHAGHNTTSVYTPALVFHMLPERLSTDLTSLGFRQDRRAMVVDMLVVEDGEVGGAEVYRALVRNHAKLAYNSVAAWLDGEVPPPAALEAVEGLDRQLRLQDRVAQALRRWRQERGALVFQTLEARPVFDGDMVKDLRAECDNRARGLIEDFMLAANGATARLLEARGFPSIRRVVRSPERWDRIEALAAGLGERLPPDPDPIALAAFLARRRAADPSGFPDLSLAVIKLIGAGEYAVERVGEDGPGHFGLAVKDYTHSTAPNRRFPDLVTQRLLKAAIDAGRPPYGEAQLEAMAAHCTEMEDEAHKVERRVKKAAAALLLEGRIGQVFDAIVTGAARKGTWVRLLHPPIEGRLERGFEGVDVGDRLRVRLIHTDVEQGHIDFARA
jgi:exoribonuclease-2